MANDHTYDIPLEALAPGDHLFSYELDDAFFIAYEPGLVEGGQFKVELVVSRVRNQFTLDVHALGAATVTCDRCLGTFDLPLELRDEVIVKFDNGIAREEAEVIYVPYGTERFDVAKVIYDSIGLSLPMRITHDQASLECDADVTKYLSDSAAEVAAEPETQDESSPIADDSPWSVLRDLGTSDN